MNGGKGFVEDSDRKKPSTSKEKMRTLLSAPDAAPYQDATKVPILSFEYFSIF
jgi:hypothetical protein